jgi:hypothetical protein
MKSVTVAVSIAFLPVAAIAHYDRTRWGMTRIEVAELYPEGFPGSDSYQVTGKVGPVWGAIAFEFGSQGLNAVRIIPSLVKPPAGGPIAPMSEDEGNSMAVRLVKLLTAKYGKPMAEPQRTSFEPSSRDAYLYVWHTDAGDFVSLEVVHVGGEGAALTQLRLRYQPLADVESQYRARIEEALKGL